MSSRALNFLAANVRILQKSHSTQVAKARKDTFAVMDDQNKDLKCQVKCVGKFTEEENATNLDHAAELSRKIDESRKLVEVKTKTMDEIEMKLKAGFTEVLDKISVLDREKIAMSSHAEAFALLRHQSEDEERNGRKMKEETDMKLKLLEMKMDRLSATCFKAEQFHERLELYRNELDEKVDLCMPAESCNEMFMMLFNQMKNKSQDYDELEEKLVRESEERCEIILSQMQNQNQVYDNLAKMVHKLEKDQHQRKKIFETKFHEFDLQMESILTEETFLEQFHEFDLHVESKMTLIVEKSEQKLLTEVKTAMDAFQYSVNVQIGERVHGSDEGHMQKKKKSKPK